MDDVSARDVRRLSGAVVSRLDYREWGRLRPGLFAGAVAVVTGIYLGFALLSEGGFVPVEVGLALWYFAPYVIALLLDRPRMLLVAPVSYVALVAIWQVATLHRPLWDDAGLTLLQLLVFVMLPMVLCGALGLLTRRLAARAGQSTQRGA